MGSVATLRRHWNLQALKRSLMSFPCLLLAWGRTPPITDNHIGTCLVLEPQLLHVSAWSKSARGWLASLSWPEICLSVVLHENYQLCQPNKLPVTVPQKEWSGTSNLTPKPCQELLRHPRRHRCVGDCLAEGRFGFPVTSHKNVSWNNRNQLLFKQD